MISSEQISARVHAHAGLQCHGDTHTDNMGHDVQFVTTLCVCNVSMFVFPHKLSILQIYISSFLPAVLFELERLVGTGGSGSHHASK